jgi:hypothetical protein
VAVGILVGLVACVSVGTICVATCDDAHAIKNSTMVKSRKYFFIG